MNIYRIAPSGQRFQVIETLLNGTENVFRGFPTEAAARTWLLKRLSLTNMAELDRWLREKPSER